MHRRKEDDVKTGRRPFLGLPEAGWEIVLHVAPTGEHPLRLLALHIHQMQASQGVVHITILLGCELLSSLECRSVL